MPVHARHGSDTRELWAELALARIQQLCLSGAEGPCLAGRAALGLCRAVVRDKGSGHAAEPLRRCTVD